MLTQSKLNSVLQRVNILLKYHCAYADNYIACDVRDFFNKLTNAEKTTKLPCPDEVEYDQQKKCLVLEWYKITKNEYFDYISIDFEGERKVRLYANYESLDIEITQTIPFSEDFPELILAHLKQFKRSIKKKKRYK